MSIKYAILGLLSWKPSTGYELKKIFEESPILYWSGNNNQIYKSPMQLLDEGLVTGEVQHQDSSPSKKVYTITDEGLDELREWVLSAHEAPEFKKTFLIRLAWADRLSHEELSRLLTGYENEIKTQQLLLKEKQRRGLAAPNRSPRETLLWNMIYENLVSSFKTELDWVRRVRRELYEKEIPGEEEKMNYKVIENGEKRYVEFISAASPLATEQDALDLVALCGEQDTNLLMLHGEALSEDFFKLRTGVAGAMLQKFSNYRMKIAAVIPEQTAGRGKFRDMVLEANRGRFFRVFDNTKEAETWLLGGPV